MQKIDLSQWAGPADEAEAKQQRTRTAILILHGIGQQNPLETLDQFARSLRIALNARYQCQYRVIHKQVNYITPIAQDVWLENYIALEADGDKPSIDIYEYYWAHQMTGQVTITDIVEWLKDTSRYARRYYRKKADERTEDEKQAFVTQYNDQPHLSNLFEPSGQFHENGYLRNLDISVRIGIYIHEFLKDSVFRNWPLIRMVYKALLRKVNTLLVDYVGDVVVYTTIDRKAKHYAVRQDILRHVRQEIEAILKNRAYGSVLIAGHSLGSVIAYDVINRLHNMPVENADAAEWRVALKRIRGLITFGSPLDKTAFFFRQQISKKAHIRRHMLNYLYSFKKKVFDDPDLDKKSVDYVDVEDETENNLNHVKWINFYDGDDPVSGHLDLYEVDENKQYCMGAGFGISHLAYWDYQPMYEKILNFYNEDIIRSDMMIEDKQ